MLPPRTGKSIRTHRHVRTMRSILTDTGPARTHWPRLRESEQIQRSVRRLQHVQLRRLPPQTQHL